MAQITLVEAITQALAFEMQRDPKVVVFGEDVGLNGGVFRATDGLQARFGCERVLDTPLAENMIAGIAIGMATQGLRPVAEFQFMGFIYPPSIKSSATQRDTATEPGAAVLLRCLPGTLWRWYPCPGAPL